MRNSFGTNTTSIKFGGDYNIARTIIIFIFIFIPYIFTASIFADIYANKILSNH